MKPENKKQISKNDLAIEIARVFKEEHRTELYQHTFQKHDISTIEKAFEETSKVPDSKIKKSKSALFFYLLNKYAEK